jgi:hypothetical protein
VKIHSISTIAFPLTQVYETYRDRLPEIAAFMPDIKTIEVKSRVDGANGPKVHNVWTASTEIPAIARRVIKPSMMQWDDHADWNDGQTYVDWRLVIPAFANQVRCSGRNSFSNAGKATRVELTGTLDIDIRSIPGVPRLLARKIKPQVEAFIGRLIQPNLETVNVSLEKFLASGL